MTRLTDRLVIFQVPVNRQGRFKPANPVFDGHWHYFTEESITKLFEDTFQIVKFFHGGLKRYANGYELLVVMEKK